MKVSICIPAYKHEFFLKRCLDSVLAQSFTDFEVIITDDSPDDTLKNLVKTYDDKRIRYFKNEKPLGSPANWNEGLKKAEGDYIKLIHHDDWFSSSQSLGEYVNILERNPEIAIAFSGCCNIDEDQNQKKHIACDKYLRDLKKEAKTVYLGNLLGAPSVCIFRNHKNLYFDPKLTWLVDSDFYIRTIQEGSFVYTTQILVNIGVSRYQITHQYLTEATKKTSEKIYLYEKFNLKDYPFKYRKSLLRSFGRQQIFSTANLKKNFPDTKLTMSVLDSLWSYYFHIRKITGIYLLGKPTL